MKKKIKYNIAYAIGLGFIGCFILLSIWTVLDRSLENLIHNDKGIILEMIGFVVYLSPIRVKLSKIFATYSEHWKSDDWKDLISIVAIGMVIIGLYFQFSFISPL